MARHLPALVRTLALVVAASGCHMPRSGAAAGPVAVHYDPVTMDPPAPINAEFHACLDGSAIISADGIATSTAKALRR